MRSAGVWRLVLLMRCFFFCSIGDGNFRLHTGQLDVVLQDNFLGDAVVAVPNGGDRVGQQAFLVVIEVHDDLLGGGLDHGAVHHLNVVKVSLVVVYRHAEYINVANGRRHNL